LMSANEKVSVIDKENFTTSKNKQLHWEFKTNYWHSQ
jgi:hypothetical protein